MNRLGAAFAALLLSVTATGQDPAPAPTADRIVLQNGDRVTGAVQSITADKVVVKSPALGDLEIPLGEIDNVSTSSPVTLETADGVVTNAVIQGLENGALRVGSGADVRSIPTGTLVVPTPPTQWQGSFNLGGQLSSGNTERRAVTLGAEAIRETKQDRLRLRGTFDYAEDRVVGDGAQTGGDWRLTQRRSYGQAKYDYFLGDSFYLLASTSGENDELSDLHLRFIAGAGVGYRWFDREDLVLNTEAGLSYVDENYSGVGAAVDPDSQFLAGRAAVSARWTIAEGLDLLHDSEVFPSLEDNEDFYARLDTRVQVTLTDNLFAQFQWILDYDNTPAAARERADHRLLASIGWSF